MSKKSIKAIKVGMLKDGYTRIAVDIKDCPCSSLGQAWPLRLEIYSDQDENLKAVLTHHCYDNQPVLKPIIGRSEIQCPNFNSCLEGQVDCKLSKG
ncbi:MAG TPA: hypothetical protein VIK72_13710 [Clostridiaceae bacterium]